LATTIHPTSTSLSATSSATGPVKPLKGKKTNRGNAWFTNSLINYKDARETAINIIAAKQPILEPWLCSYLNQRRIEKFIANKYCYEVEFTNCENEKIFKAIGFKNNAEGYELRNEYFKGSSSPKYISYLDNKADSLTVFEGFFDFMSCQSVT
jgi:hypothetical protein